VVEHVKHLLRFSSLTFLKKMIEHGCQLNIGFIYLHHTKRESGVETKLNAGLMFDKFCALRLCRYGLLRLLSGWSSVRPRSSSPSGDVAQW
jgi:hypothetical protein